MKKLLRLFASGLVAAVFALAAQAAQLAPGAYSVGNVTGDVSYKLAGSSEYLPLTPGTQLPQGVTIKTGAESSAAIVFASGSVAAITADSEIEISKFEQEVFSGPISVDSEPAVSNTEIKVVTGSVINKVNKLKKGSSYTVNSPVGAAGVRGTIFKVAYDAATGAFSIEVVEGGVTMVISGVATTVNAGKKLAKASQKEEPQLSDLPSDLAKAIRKTLRMIEGNDGDVTAGKVESVLRKRLKRVDSVDVLQIGVTVSPGG